MQLLHTPIRSISSTGSRMGQMPGLRVYIGGWVFSVLGLVFWVLGFRGLGFRVYRV